MQSNELSKILSNRSAELGLSIEELTTKAGFRDAAMTRLILDGDAKLPLDHVLAVAEALELPADRLPRLALMQFFDEASISVLGQLFHQSF